MKTKAFWEQFGETEQKGIKIALASFITFVAVCTLWGGLAAKSWSSAPAIFVDAVGAFGQVSIAAGLYLLTRHQLHEARIATQKATEALELAKAEAEAEADRHNRELVLEQERQAVQYEREQSRENQAETEYLKKLFSKLDIVCGSIIEHARNQETIESKYRDDLKEYVSLISTKPIFDELSDKLKTLMEVGVRVGGSRQKDNDFWIFFNTRKYVLKKLREITP